MKTTLLTVGIGCIIAAIVGGGLKAFQMEIPLVNSQKRQLLLSFFGMVLIAASFVVGESPQSNLNSATPLLARPRLSYGTWTFRNAIDDQGNDFTNSTLRFTSQEETSNGLVLKGSITWRRYNILAGTEEVTGNYVDATRQIILEGVSVKSVDPGPGLIITGSYSAIVSSDERALINGRWGSTMENEPAIKGTWEATR